MNPDNQTKPYAQVHVTVSKPDLPDRTFRNVQIFAQESAAAGDLLNADEELAPQFEEFIEIPEHAPDLLDGSFLRLLARRLLRF